MSRTWRFVGLLALWAAIVVVGLGGLIVRLSIEGERALERSDAEFDHGRLRESLLFARRAASLYAPGLVHVRRADARLDAIAMGAEASQRQELAMLAWHAIRSTELQRRWGLGRPSDRAKRAERRLAAHLADDGRQGSLVEQERYSRRVFADLERSSSHRSHWRSIALVASLGMISAGLVAAYVRFGRGNPRKAWLWAATGLIGIGAAGWAILSLWA